MLLDCQYLAAGPSYPGTEDLFIADTNNIKIAEVACLAQSGDAAGPTAAAHS
jgi:hypothetical protein